MPWPLIRVVFPTTAWPPNGFALGCDGDLVFWGFWVGMITKIREWLAPYLFSVHCVAHRTNLVVLVLSKLSLVAHIEGMS